MGFRFSFSLLPGDLVAGASGSTASVDVEVRVLSGCSPSGDFVAVLLVVLRSVVVCAGRFAGALERFEEGFSSASVFLVVGAFLPGADFFAVLVFLVVDAVVCLVVLVFLATAVLPLALRLLFAVAGCDDSSGPCCWAEDWDCDEPDLALVSDVLWALIDLVWRVAGRRGGSFSRETAPPGESGCERVRILAGGCGSSYKCDTRREG